MDTLLKQVPVWQSPTQSQDTEKIRLKLSILNISRNFSFTFSPLIPIYPFYNLNGKYLFVILIFQGAENTEIMAS